MIWEELTMANFGMLNNLVSIMGMARRNPQQAVMQLLQQGVQNGRINQQQYSMLMNGMQNGGNPNQIIQQMLNSGMVSQQDYESARQDAATFR